MKKFGELNGVTASSLLLLGDKSLDFLKVCNKSIDELNLASMSSELTYLNTVKIHIEDILKSKPEFRINNSANPEEILRDILSSLTLIIKNRTGIESNFGNKTNLFSQEEDLFSDLFDEDSDESDGNLFDDMFGEEVFESDTTGLEEKLENGITINNLIEFSKSAEYIQNALDISDIDVNNFIDELTLFKECRRVFDSKCKDSDNVPINESPRIKKMLESGRGNLEIIEFVNKSYNRLSLFHLSFNELSGLVKELEDRKLFENDNRKEVDTSMYSPKVIAIGDNLAYLIYSNMSKVDTYSSNTADLLTKLVAFCDVKATKSSNKSKILGIPLNLCYLKFKGSNYRSFCENLELVTMQTPDRSIETYKLTVKSIVESLQVISNYINTINFDRKNDLDFNSFKEFLTSYIKKSEFKEYFSDIDMFVRELDNKKLIPSNKQLYALNEDKDKAIEDYATDIYDTFKLYRFSRDFSLDYYNSLLPQEVIDNFGVLDIDTFIEVNCYLRDIYKIIPLTISNYVRSKVLATSKTNKVVNKDVYNEIKPLVELVLENFESKYYMSDLETYSGTLIIS